MRRFALLASFAVLTSACAIGPRPTFEASASQELTGRPEIDDVLERLDATPFAQFSADYVVVTKFDQLTSDASVVQANDGRRSITINQVRYIVDGASQATCDLAVGQCEATINDARTSDVLLTHEFYAAAFATRLRVDAQRRIGDPISSEITVGGEQALCVDIPVTGATKRYCALASGPLALYDGNDVNIQLTRYNPTPDESKFATS
jgi:hypothetical protein